MSSLPFHSEEVRDALAAIVAGHRDDAEDDGRGAGRPSATAAGGGRGRPSSSDEEEDDEDGSEDDGASSDGDASSSSDPSRPLEPVEEDVAGASDAVEKPSPQGRHQPEKGKPRNQKSKQKRSKDNLSQRMGKAPSILIPFEYITAKKPVGRKALEVPSVLLPHNYLRDNPNWRASPVATSLLATWERLNDPANLPTVVVALLQSGRFAAAVFALRTHHNVTSMKMLAHKTSTRYTVRKGQGGSQSSHDQAKNKAKSVGAQLRREGERQLREDVHQTWREWKKLGYVDE